MKLENTTASKAIFYWKEFPCLHEYFSNVADFAIYLQGRTDVKTRKDILQIMLLLSRTIH